MERIEIEPQLSLNDCHMSIIVYQWVTGTFKTYAATLCLAYLGGIALYYLALRFEWYSVCRRTWLVFAATFFSIILLFAYNLGRARRSYLTWSKRKEKRAFYFDGIGFGRVSYVDGRRTREIFNQWEDFKFVYETKRFFFLNMRNGPAITIVKRYISNDNIIAIREIFRNSLVDKKRLL